MDLSVADVAVSLASDQSNGVVESAAFRDERGSRGILF
jgi:hypothetical protein